MDTTLPERPRRNAVIPERARDYLDSIRKPRLDGVTQDEDNSASGSQAARRSKRNSTVPARAMQEVTERAEKVAQHERHLAAKKRKAFAEARDNSDDEESGVPKRQRKEFDDDLLAGRYEDLDDEDERLEWLLVAIFTRYGYDFRNSDATLEELETLWYSENVGKGKSVDHYRGIKIDPVAHPAAKGSQPNKLKPTDHTTIGLSGEMVYKNTRGPSGKLVPIDGYKGKLTPDTPPSQSAPRQTSVDTGANSSTTNAATPTDVRVKPFRSTGSNFPADFRISPVPQPKPRPSGRPFGSQPIPVRHSSASLPRSPAPAGSQPAPTVDHSSPGVSAPRESRHAPYAPASAGNSRTDPRASSPSPPPPDALPFAPRPRRIAVADDTDDEEEEPEEEDEDAEDAETLPQSAGGQLPSLEDAVVAMKLTKRQRTQLRRFGLAKKPVKRLAQLVKLRGITKCAYADIMPFYTKPDRNGKVYEDGTIAEHWLPELWAQVNHELRPRDPPLPLLEEYCSYALDDLSGMRHQLKAVAQVLVPSKFDFKRGYSVENKNKFKNLLPLAFTSPDLVQPSKKQFQHDIIPEAIRQTWFLTKRSFGTRNAADFHPMPLPVIAFVCTIVHFLITEYKSGEQQCAKLNAEDQVPYFEMFVEQLEDMAKPGHAPHRLAKLQRRLFRECHGKLTPTSRVKIQCVPVDYGTDSEEEFASGDEMEVGDD